jgi:hypothetical protein
VRKLRNYKHVSIAATIVSAAFAVVVHACCLGGMTRICMFCGACDIAKNEWFHLLQSTPDFINLTFVWSNRKGTIIQSKKAEISQKLETEKHAHPGNKIAFFRPLYSVHNESDRMQFNGNQGAEGASSHHRPKFAAESQV